VTFGTTLHTHIVQQQLLLGITKKENLNFPPADFGKIKKHSHETFHTLIKQLQLYTSPFFMVRNFGFSGGKEKNFGGKKTRLARRK